MRDRCRVRDDRTGRLCGRVALRELSVYEETEFGGGWFWVPICEKHMELRRNRDPGSWRRIPASRAALEEPKR